MMVIICLKLSTEYEIDTDPQLLKFIFPMRPRACSKISLNSNRSKRGRGASIGVFRVVEVKLFAEGVAKGR